MRVIAVGDDDQNIYEFRKSDSKYFYELSKENCNIYELTTNFRSKSNLVEFSQIFAAIIKKRYKEQICESYTTEEGYIRIIKHDSEYLYIPVLNHIIGVNNKSSLAVLTNTNEEAEIISSLLLKEGLRVRLLQGNNSDLKLNQLFEFYYFLSRFDKNDKIITQESWKEHFKEFIQKYVNSPLIDDFIGVLSGFEILYPKTKYFIDLITYLRESRLQDLYQTKPDVITVSTIHKAKGTEFESVFIMTSRINYNDERLRAMYVGITRAKTNLIIHTKSNLFDNIECHNLVKTTNKIMFEKPDELIMQLTHRDVNLGGGLYTEHNIWKVETNSVIDINLDGCTFQDKPVLYFSSYIKNEISIRKEKG